MRQASRSTTHEQFIRIITGCMFSSFAIVMMVQGNVGCQLSPQAEQVIRTGMHESDVYRLLGEAPDADGYGNGDEVLIYPPDMEVVVNVNGIVTELRKGGQRVDELRLRIP
jgi:hypothetical protein